MSFKIKHSCLHFPLLFAEISNNFVLRELSRGLLNKCWVVYCHYWSLSTAFMLHVNLVQYSSTHILWPTRSESESGAQNLFILFLFNGFVHNQTLDSLNVLSTSLSTSISIFTSILHVIYLCHPKPFGVYLKRYTTLSRRVRIYWPAFCI